MSSSLLFPTTTVLLRMSVRGDNPIVQIQDPQQGCCSLYCSYCGNNGGETPYKNLTIQVQPSVLRLKRLLPSLSSFLQWLPVSPTTVTSHYPSPFESPGEVPATLDMASYDLESSYLRNIEDSWEERMPLLLSHSASPGTYERLSSPSSSPETSPYGATRVPVVTDMPMPTVFGSNEGPRRARPQLSLVIPNGDVLVDISAMLQSPSSCRGYQPRQCELGSAGSSVAWSGQDYTAYFRRVQYQPSEYDGSPISIMVSIDRLLRTVGDILTSALAIMTIAYVVLFIGLCVGWW